MYRLVYVWIGGRVSGCERKPDQLISGSLTSLFVVELMMPIDECCQHLYCICVSDTPTITIFN